VKSLLAEIAVNVPLSRSFHYRVPEHLAGILERGHRVLIPFGHRETTGVLVGFPDETAIENLKPIREILHPDCRFDEHLLELTRWIADYYRVSWGEVLEAALPPTIRQRKKEKTVRSVFANRPPAELEAEAARVERRSPARARLLRRLAEDSGPHPRTAFLTAARTSAVVLTKAIAEGWAIESAKIERPDPYRTDPDRDRGRIEPVLNSEQVAAIETLRTALASHEFRPILLHGVTGSGKTEVYLRALREVIARGGRGLVLVPEISLTPQTVQRFREGLAGQPVAVLHSMLSPAERTGQWRDIQEGKAKLIIGARSAAFAPIPKLGLIIVDEEHESSYKQESSPRYHGRDVAVVRARLLSIPIVLGSATPSLESAYNVRTGKYRLIELTRRATAHDLPSVTIVPLESKFYASDGSGLVSAQLDYHIRRTLGADEQALIFLNRRGFATYLHCVRCGFVLRCRDCDVTLTFHRGVNIARCHYCGFTSELPESCPDCKMPGPRKSGVGTEKVVAALEKRYPTARIARLDRDTATTHDALKSTLSKFAAGTYNVLVGTQMIAKGHDFPGVSLVGILLADVGLHVPDFRAAERTYQLITQVAGRAGRGERPGRVIVQTFFPEHFAIRCATEGNYHGFVDRELEVRRSFQYPPFGRLVKVMISGTDEEKVREEASRIAESLKRAAPPECRILGAVASPVSRIQTRYRMQILLKAKLSTTLHDLLAKCEKDLASKRGVDVTVDIDPQNLT
jgi:primosomal protein N' (replication factor Y)